jgi:hypothetical protein
MSRSNGAGYVLIVAVAFAIVVVALRSTTTETEVLPPVSLPDPGADSPSAVVISTRESGGFSLFGLTFGEQTRTVTVQFYAPEGCYEQLATGDRWPVAYEQCAGPVEVDGTVSGGGIAATGESIVAVDVVVDEACFDSIRAGDPWPQPACG